MLDREGPPRSRHFGPTTWIALGLGLSVAAADVICLISLGVEMGRLVVFGSIVAAVGAVGAAVLVRNGFRRATMIVLLAELVMVAAYLACTGFDQRNYDALAHLQYIHRIADQHELPMAADCGICHHPPLYHLLAAVVMSVANGTGIVSAPFALQVLSVGLLFVFLAFGIRTVELLTSNPRVQPWAAAFLAFWPTSILNSVRLNNDLLLYALMSAGMYYLVRWRRDGAGSSLAVACALAVAASFTKLNGLILAGAIVGLFVWDLLRRGRSRARGRGAAPAVAAMLAMLTLMAGVRMWRESGSLSQRALGAAASSATITRTFSGYFWLDLGEYAKQPVAIATMRGPYWNHLLKSSLFGTRSLVLWIDGPMPRWSRPLALAEGWLLLALIAYVAVVGLVLRRLPRDHRGMSLYLAACFLGAGLSFHVWAPKPHHTDFRFIYPILVPAAAIFFEVIFAAYRRRRTWGVLGYGLLSVFLAVSATYFAIGFRPSAARILARALPGPNAEKAGTNPLRLLQGGSPRSTPLSR